MLDDVFFDMLYDYNFDMFYDYSFERIFWNYYHSRKKRIVLTVRLRLLTLRYQVSTISESNFWCSSVWYAIWLSFANEQGKIFVHKIIFVRKNLDILLTKMPRRSGAKITSQLDNLRIPYNRKCLLAKSVAFQLLLKECKYMYGTYCWYHR